MSCYFSLDFSLDITSSKYNQVSTLCVSVCVCVSLHFVQMLHLHEMIFNCDESVTFLVNSLPSSYSRKKTYASLCLIYCISLLFGQVALASSSSDDAETSNREPRQCKLLFISSSYMPFNYHSCNIMIIFLQG